MQMEKLKSKNCMSMKNKLKVLTTSLVLLVGSLTYAQSPATSGSFTATCIDVGTVNWTNPGTVNNILVFAKAGSPITIGTPTANISTYPAGSANSIFTSATTPYQNDASAFLVYRDNNTTNSFGLTGLTPGVTYHFLIYNATGTTYSTPLIFSNSTLTTPANASAFNGIAGNASVSLSWTNPGTCIDELLIIGKSISVTGNPSGNGGAYTGNLNFTAASAPDFDAAAKTLYKGSTSPQVITNLTNGTQYFFKIFTRKGSTWSSGTEINVTPQPQPVTGGSFSPSCVDAGSVNWSNPVAVSTIVVFAKAGSAITVGSPTLDVSNYTANIAFGSGDPYENDANAYCIYKGSSTSENIGVLLANTSYHFLAFNVDGTVYSSAHQFNNTTLTTPPNVTGIGGTPGNESLSINWTNVSCSDEILIVAKAGSPATGTPTGNGSSYSTNLNFSTAAAADFDASAKVVYKGSSSPQVITNLANGTSYHVTIYTRKNSVWSTGTTTIGIPIDNIPPTVVSLSPSDNSINVATNTSLVIEFSEPVFISSTGASGIEDDIRVREVGTTIETISRGSGNISIVGNIVTISISDLPNLNTAYHIRIGDKVFSDAAGNDYAGFDNATTWNFVTSTGVTITPGTGAANTVTFSTISDIIISENGTNDLSAGTNRTLKLELNGGGYIFDTPGTPSVSFTPGRNITAASLSMDFTSLTVTYTVSGTNLLDQLTVSGLGLKTSSTSNPTRNIVRVASGGSEATIIGSTASIGQTFGSITSCNTASPGLSFTGAITELCQGASIIGITVSATGGGSIRWFNNINLTSEIVSAAGNMSPTAAALGFSTTSPSTITKYATLTSGCQSAPTAITLVINPLPVADAGINGETFCSDVPVSLGGSPTLATESSPGLYTYAWTDLSGNYTLPIAGNSNPTFNIENTSGTTKNYQFRVTITDSKSCTATDVKTLSVTTEPFAFLSSPSTTFFSPSSSEQLLSAEPPNGIFTGVGVVQTGPNEYKFNPPSAYNESAALPQNFQIFYSGVDTNGCPINNSFPITTITLSDQAFAISSEYCSTEKPFIVNNGEVLEIPAALNTQAKSYVTTWNTTSRLNRYPFNTSPAWNAFFFYNAGNLVTYDDGVNGLIVYRSLAFHSGVVPTNTSFWEVYATLQVTFNGDIRNWYEGFYGGNLPDVTLRRKIATYNVGSDTYFQHEFFTNPNYARCLGCSYLYPGIYLRMVRPQDARFLLPAWNAFSTYRAGNLVRYGVNDDVYEMTNATQNVTGGSTPDLDPFYWTLRTTTYDNGNYYRSGSASGFFYTGQFVEVNQVPNVSFSGLVSGLPNPDDFCNESQNFILTGSQIGSGTFTGSANGSSFSNITGLLSGAPSPGRALFNPEIVFTALGAGASARNFYIRYSFDTQRNGSTGQDCLAEYTTPIPIEIYPLPTIDFGGTSPVDNSVFCYNEVPVVLNASETTGVSFSGLGVTNTAVGQGSFNPIQAFTQRETELGSTQTSAQNFDVTVTYTNTIGCTQDAIRNYQVRPLPPAAFNFGLKTTYFTSTNPSGRYNIYYVQSSSSTILIDTEPTNGYSFDPSFIFDQAVSVGGASALSTPTIRVVFTTNDPVKTACENTQITDMIVAPVIPVSIAGFNAEDEIYCSNEGARSLTLSPPNGSLRINGSLQTIFNGPSSAVFNFSQPAGVYNIEYQVITGTSCTNTDFLNITLAPSPVANFAVNAKCEGDLITFDADNDPNNKIWTWTFIDSVRTGNLDNIQFKFPGSGSYPVKLRTEADPFGPLLLVCKDSVERTQIIGLNPKVSFDFANVCEGDETRFSVNSTVTAIDRVRWNFGDSDITTFGGTSAPLGVGDTHGGRSSGTYGIINHTFQSENDFNVIVTGRTPTQFGSCEDSDTIKVSVLRNITPTPLATYFMKDLNGGNGFWKTEDINGNSTWEYGVKTGSPVTNQISAWTTNPLGPHMANDLSYVNSPCFNLSAFTKPTISLQYWVNADDGKDGAILQYSLDGGASWERVGNQSSGKEWFNEAGISSFPPINENLFGWSGTSTTEWKTGKHSLNIIPLNQLDNVRFRLAFSSDERDEFGGFAFGDVRIEQRNRTMLVENFTNPAASNASQNLLNFNAIQPDETVKIQYHTAFPANDPINSANPMDHNARAAFYGLNSSIQNSGALVPRGYIDGTSQGNFIGAWSDNYLSLQSLVSAPVSLTVTDLVAELGQIKAAVTVTALEDILVNPARNYRLFIVVVEKQFTANNNRFIMRRMLPDAAGIVIPNKNVTTLANKNDVLTFTTDSFEIPGVEDPSQLAIVAFIQDINSKEVIQSGLLSTLVNPFTIETNVETQADGIIIFPNPANESFVIELPSKTETRLSVNLIDPVGRPIQELFFEKGEHRKTINTQELAGGIYVIQIGAGKSGAIRKKVMVVHKN
jgi:hypothetical protein